MVHHRDLEFAAGMGKRNELTKLLKGSGGRLCMSWDLNIQWDF